MPRLTTKQAEFLNRPERFRAFVAGFGSGKTWAGAAGICQTSLEYPGALLGYFGPTHAHTRDIFYPTIEEVAFDWGLDCKVYPANREAILSYGGVERTVIKCRSMDRPGSIVGFKMARGVVDEIDTMPMQKATDAWRKIQARLRQSVPGLQNGCDVTTTPEGFRFAYQTFVKAVRDNPALAANYSLTRCSTYENGKNLPDGYIDSMFESYPENLISAYLFGYFVNLTQGSVYRQFDRILNGSKETIKANEPLFIGMDFNVGKMSAVVHVKRDGWPHAVDELVGQMDTPAMIEAIQGRYWKYEKGDYKKTHQIRVYPDSTGGSRKSVNASTSDIQLLKDAGFSVIAPKKNPPVKDRLNAMNGLICNAKGERRYLVNSDKCPTHTENLEQQAFDKNGEPDKAHDQDHTPDAAGYFISKDYPVSRPVKRLNIGVAV